MDALGLTEHMSSYIIRPPRPQYHITELGQTKFEFKGIIYQRIDVTIPATPNNVSLECSFYVDKFNQNKQRTTLVYLHANSSNRASAKNYLKYLLPHFDIVTFDFRGCGMSEGKFITLGYLQKWDVKAVIEFIDTHFGERKYILWGRSMGAVTAILYAAKFQAKTDKIAAMVLDSPFSNLQKIIYFIAENKLPLLPKFMLQSAFQNLEQHTKTIIHTQYGRQFLISKHKPINQIYKIKVPMFFIASRDDKLVDPKQVIDIYENAIFNKQLQILQGGHNQPRPQHLKIAIVEFLLASINMKRQIIERKKIFSYKAYNYKNSPFANTDYEQDFEPVESHIQEEKQRRKSRLGLQKSNKKAQVWSPRARKQNLFKDHSKSRIDYSQVSFQMNEANKSMNNMNGENELMINSENRQSIKQTHQNILDKLIPKSSTRRANRIFNGPALTDMLSKPSVQQSNKNHNDVQSIF